MNVQVWDSVNRFTALVTIACLASHFVPVAGAQQSIESSPQQQSDTKHTVAPLYQRWPFSSAEAAKRQQETSAAIGLPIEMTNSIGMKFQLIPAGEFMMGSSETDREGQNDEFPAHRVRITEPFYLGNYEVTRGQFRKFIDATGYKTDAERDGRGGWGYTGNDARPFKRAPEFTWSHTGFEQDDEHPAVNVSWNDAVAFCKWLSRVDNEVYRLPTEAEWKYACRAGTETPWHHGDNPEGLAKVGNVSDATSNEKFSEWMKVNEVDRLKMGTSKHVDGFALTAPVGHFEPNAFGLFDMHGNVWEWCEDWDKADYYAESPLEDPRGPERGKSKIRRGGSWLHSPTFARSARRRRYAPDARNSPIGFRVVMSLDRDSRKETVTDKES